MRPSLPVAQFICGERNSRKSTTHGGLNVIDAGEFNKVHLTIPPGVVHGVHNRLLRGNIHKHANPLEGSRATGPPGFETDSSSKMRTLQCLTMRVEC